MSNCITSKIGVKGLCDNVDYSILLDNYGISLKKIAATAPASISSAKEYLQALINDGVNETLLRIRFDGVEIGKIISSFQVGGLTDTNLTFSGDKALTFETLCTTTAYYLDGVWLYGNGTTDLKISIDGNVTNYGNYVVAGKKYVSLGLTITEPTFQIIVNGNDFTAKEVSMANYVNYCCKDMYFTPIENFSYGVLPNISLRCDLTNYYCQFADLIANAAKFKVIAKILHSIKYTDRLNEYVLFKDTDKIYELMSFYDSEFNMAYLNGDLTKSPKGQFQISMDSLNIPKPECTCCKPICKERYQFALSSL